MRPGQLIDYNLRNIFHEKSYTKCGGEPIHKPFSKKSNLSISLDQCSKVSYILFLLFVKLRTIENDWSEAADDLHWPYIKLFQKQKEVLN